MTLSRGKGSRAAVQVTTIDNEAVDIAAVMPVDPSGNPLGPAVDDALSDTAAGSTNGDLIKPKPAGATALVMYLTAGSSITYTIATAAPASPPANTITISGSSYAQWSEALGPSTNLYVTAKTGTVLCRYV